MTRRWLLSAALLASCDKASPSFATDASAILPIDAAVDVSPEDAPAEKGPASSACSKDADCLGGTCLGLPGTSTADNVRFTGGYCTTLGCTPLSQEGCGPDEWCLDDGGVGPYCVALCSKADGLECVRADHVCLGLGNFGACFARTAVECDSKAHTGCDEGQICARIGYEDPSLGRCFFLCHPVLQDCAATHHACYYIRRYNAAFCSEKGTALLEEPCSCDKCCTPGLACTPDLDGIGRHCKDTCAVVSGCAVGECIPLEDGSPWGGCVEPGSTGT